MAKKHVVIIGAGGYGARVAKTLSSKLDPTEHTLTLITSREYYVHLPAVLRMVVSPMDDLFDNALLPYDRLLDQRGVGSVKRGTVTQVKKNADGKSGSVVLASGEELPWDVLLLSLGNEWEGVLRLPETRKEAEVFVDGWRKRFEQANKIALIGGGAVGSELAGELRDIYPEKKITLVHADNLLINSTYPTKYRKTVESKLRARNIDVLLDTRVENIPADGLNDSVKSTDGKLIEADLVVPTRGGRPATSFLNTLSPNTLNNTGHIKVKRTLQLLFESNIFAVGDVTDIKEEKMIGKVHGYIDIISGNIVALLNGKGVLKEYKGASEAIFLTNGKYGGAGWLWGFNFGDWAVANVKSKGLFVSPTRKFFGFTA